ncbi:MAG: hypothetical protein RR235_07935 [Oscillospiraceae bacterium]
MKKQFCPYCGEPLTAGCDCGIRAAEEEAAFIEDYENRPETQDGWAFQDKLDTLRREY